MHLLYTYKTDVFRYIIDVFRYITSAIYLDTYIPKYISSIPAYISYIPKYITYIPKYISYIPTYISFIPKYITYYTYVKIIWLTTINKLNCTQSIIKKFVRKAVPDPQISVGLPDDSKQNIKVSCLKQKQK